MEAGGNWGNWWRWETSRFPEVSGRCCAAPWGLKSIPAQFHPLAAQPQAAPLSPRFAPPTAFLPWVQAPPPGGAHAAGVATYSRGRCGNCLGGFCRVSFNVGPPQPTHPITITILDVLLCQSVRGQRAVGSLPLRVTHASTRQIDRAGLASLLSISRR